MSEYRPIQANRVKYTPDFRVLMLPTYHGGNKYGPALVNSICQEGVDLQFISQWGEGEWVRFFPIVTILRTIGLFTKRRIIHLQWIDSYVVKTVWWKSLLALLIYFSGILTIKILRIKLVWTIHDYYYQEADFLQLDTLIRKITAKLTDAMIVHSIQAKDEIAKLYKLSETHKQKINVIPHGHYIDQYPNNISQSEAREHLRLDKDALLLGFIGYIRPYKGITELIEAFGRVKGDNIHLLIAGLPFDASFGEIIKKSAANDKRIHLDLRFIADEELQIFFNAVDVIVLPFKRGLTSGSLLLAMSFGKAVIASKFVSVSEVLPPGGGLIYSQENPQGLIQALHQIQTLDIAAMGQKNLERVQIFNWASIARATIQVYQETLH